MLSSSNRLFSAGTPASMMDFDFNVDYFTLKQVPMVDEKLISDDGQNQTLVVCRFGCSLIKEHMIVLL